MKKVIRMKFQYFTLLTILLCAGCSSFTHQTSTTSPHGLLTVLPEPFSSEGVSRRIIKVDGKKVPYRTNAETYRIATGEHRFFIKTSQPVTNHATDGDKALAGLVVLGTLGASIAGHNVPSPNSIEDTYVELEEVKFSGIFTVLENHTYILDTYGISEEKINQ